MNSATFGGARWLAVLGWSLIEGRAAQNLAHSPDLGGGEQEGEQIRGGVSLALAPRLGGGDAASHKGLELVSK